MLDRRITSEPIPNNKTTTSISTPIVLTIAGSDSGGGAGIQADIKAISATGSYACSAITAITAQNTLGVSAIFPIPLDYVEKQLDAVFSDITINAIKIGMLADSNIINLVAAKLQQYQPKHLVLDPVMVATSGDPLLETSAIDTLKNELLCLADIITPNLPEAALLTNKKIPTNEAEMMQMADDLRQLNAKAILLKGGHLSDSIESVDLLITKDNIEIFRSKRINTQNTHGTGCTLSSAIASYLAQGYLLKEAVSKAKNYLYQAIAQADTLNIGQGHGPVHHFFALEQAHANTDEYC